MGIGYRYPLFNIVIWVEYFMKTFRLFRKISGMRKNSWVEFVCVGGCVGVCVCVWVCVCVCARARALARGGVGDRGWWLCRASFICRVWCISIIRGRLVEGIWSLKPAKLPISFQLNYVLIEQWVESRVVHWGTPMLIPFMQYKLQYNG